MKRFKLFAIFAAAVIVIGTVVSMGSGSGGSASVISRTPSSGTSSSTSTVIEETRKITLIADVLEAGNLELHVFNGQTEVEPVEVDLGNSGHIDDFYSFEVIPGYTTIQFAAYEAKAPEETKGLSETKASDDPRSSYGFWVNVLSEDSTLYTSENIREPSTFTIPSYASLVIVEGRN